MMQWKALTVCGGDDKTFASASAICYCLNFQQGDENPRSKWIFPNEISGEPIIESVIDYGRTIFTF